MNIVYTKSRASWGIIPALLFLSIAVAGCQAADSSLDGVRNSGTLRVGLDPTYPPFEVADADGVTGFDVDLAAELAARLSEKGGPSITPAFTYFGYDGLYDALLTNQVDVLISALVIAPERTRDFAYSHTYYDAGQVLLVPLDSTITDQTALAGKRLAVELGALGHVEALALERTLAGLEVRPYGSADEALQAVITGEADAALVDSISGRLFLKTDDSPTPPLRLLPEPVSSELFAVVVRIEDETLLEAINTELAAMETDGRLEALVSRWLGP